jgi:hypothetical protein
MASQQLNVRAVDVYLHRAEEERAPQANAQPEGGRVLVLGVVQQALAAR